MRRWSMFSAPQDGAVIIGGTRVETIKAAVAVLEAAQPYAAPK